MLYRSTEAHQNHRFQFKSAKSNHSIDIHHGQPSTLLTLPGESLTHITSFLEPPSLLAIGRTNKQLHGHIEDDNTWHRAFVCQFLGIAPESDLHDAKSLMLRRSESTWRKELVAHYNLRRRWERSRSPTVTHIPQHSTVSDMHAMPENSLLATSLQYGVVSRSLPLTGKILRGYLDASGTGLGIGNPNAEFTPNVSACALASDGGTARILWGFRTGDVAVTTASRAMDSRAAAKLVRCAVGEAHQGAVQTFAWDVGSFVSGGADGQVKVWDAKSVKCLWTSSGSLVPDPCVRVACALDRGVVVAAMRSGEVVAWMGLATLLSEQSSIVSVTDLRIPSPVPSGHEITSLYLYLGSTHISILASYAAHPYFYRFELRNPAMQMKFGDAAFGPITAIYPVFSTGPQQESSFIITGDQLGCVSVYDWDAESAMTLPVRKFEAHAEDGAVTALAWNGVVLVAGSARGTVRVFDALTFEPLRAFSSPSPRPTAGAEWEPVSQILLEREMIIVSVGARVMAWKAGPVISDKAGKKGKHGHVKNVKRGGNANAKWHQQLELHRDITEYQREFEHERRYTQQVYSREREQQSTLENLGLDEVGAVEYALMLSRDEAEAQGGRFAEEEGVFEADFEDLPSTLSRRGLPRTSPSMSHHKVQVSPRFRPEPTEAGPSVSPLDIDFSLRVAPLSTSSNFPAMSSSASSASQLSTPGSSGARQTALGSGTPESMRSAWSTPRRSAPSSVVSSPPLVSRSTTRRSEDNSTSPSPSHEQIEAAADEDMDADLRLAIELSLVEVRSRGDNV